MDWSRQLDIRVLQCRDVTLERWRHSPLGEPFWRLYHNADHGWWVRQRRRRIALDPEHVVVVPPGTVYHAEGPETARHLYIHFTLGGLAGRADPVLETLMLDPVLADLVARARGPHAETEPWRLQADALALIGACLGRLPPAALHVPTLPAAIAQAVAHLERNPHRTVSGEELAALVDMHPNALIRRFRQALGEPPHRHHLRLRLERAAAALLHGDDPIETVAAAHGFCDRNHFTRAFTRWRGEPPARYRQLARGD